MIILGIDPGYAIVGFGVIGYSNNKLTPIEYGAITTPAGLPLSRRLYQISTDMEELIAKLKPEAIAVEELFFNTNITTGIRVAEARGVILLCGQQRKLRISEYTPLQVKQAVVGYGRAEKKQVITMVTSLLKLPAPPKPDDTADALAIAICHAQYGGTTLKLSLRTEK